MTTLQIGPNLTVGKYDDIRNNNSKPLCRDNQRMTRANLIKDPSLWKRFCWFLKGMLLDVRTGWGLLLLVNGKVAEYDGDVVLRALPDEVKVRMAKTWVTVYQSAIEIGVRQGDEDRRELRIRASRIADNAVKGITGMYPDDN